MGATTPLPSSCKPTKYSFHHSVKIYRQRPQLPLPAWAQERGAFHWENRAGTYMLMKMVPKPSKSSSFCCMCRIPFDDYLTVLIGWFSTSTFPNTFRHSNLLPTPNTFKTYANCTTWWRCRVHPRKRPKNTARKFRSKKRQNVQKRI